MGRLARALFLVLLAATLAGCGVVGGSSKSETDLAADALNRGLKAHQAGQLDEATVAYFETLSHDPKNKFAYFNLGQIAQTQKRSQIAEGYYRSALLIDQNYAPALYNLGIIRADAGSRDEAIDLFRRCIQNDPSAAGAYYNLGTLLRAAGQTAEANQMFQKAQQLDPKLVPPAAPTSTPAPTGVRTPSPSPTR